MTQYLLSAHSVEGHAGTPMTEEQMHRVYTDVMGSGSGVEVGRGVGVRRAAARG
jgi:hypothetical protein